MEMTYSGKTRSAKNISQHQADAVTSRPIITGIAPIKLLGGGLWGARRIFSRSGQIRGLGTKVPRGSRDGAPVRVWGEAPEADDRCENSK